MGWDWHSTRLAARYLPLPGIVLVNNTASIDTACFVAYPYLDTNLPLLSNAIEDVNRTGSFPYGFDVEADH